MRALILFLFVSAILPGAATAQDISVKLSQMPIGSWWVTSSGKSQFMNILRKRQGKRFIVDIVKPSDPNGTRLGRLTLDSKGNIQKRSYTDGPTTVFSPHNCQRVLGRCEFTTKQTGNGVQRQGQTAKMVRTTSKKGKGFTFIQTFGEPGAEIHLTSGTVLSLDKFGIVERARGKNGLKKTKFTLRKLKASWD